LGILADLVDDNLAMGEHTTIMCVKCFAIEIMHVFGSTYLRAPNVEDTTRLLELMSTHDSVLVDSVGPPSAEVYRAAASFP
jgi:hypothetical protein